MRRALLWLALLAASSALAQEDPWAEAERWAAETAAPNAPEEPAPEGGASSELQLRRQNPSGSERVIRVIREGSDESGIFAICGPGENEAPDAPTWAVFSDTGGGVQIVIDDKSISVPLAVVRQNKNGDGEIEAGGGVARYLDNAPPSPKDKLESCGVFREFKSVQDAVTVKQGATRLIGQSLRYSEDEGIVNIAGPVRFNRDAEGEKGDLSGTGGRIEFDIDRELMTLVGDVELKSAGGRTSRAARVVYNDTKQWARLLGEGGRPAVSRKDGETLQAAEIWYDLARDEVVARAGASGRIVGEITEETAAP